MKTSQKGIDLIKKYEGCRLTAYLCPANVWTIGYGHTAGVKKGQVITQTQAEKFLVDDLVKYEARVNKYYATYTWNQNEFDALVSFAYNLGSIDQLTANGTRSRSVIAEKIIAYNKAGEKVLNGLVRRRAEEQALFMSKAVNIAVERDKTIVALQTVIDAKPDGIPGPETLSKCPTLRRNDRSDVVAWLQAKLGITADGIFGINTLNAIFKFQRENGLVVDGIFGQKSWKKMLGL